MIKIKLQVIDKNAQGISVILKEEIIEIPLNNLSIIEQKEFIAPLKEWAILMKEQLESVLDKAGIKTKYTL